jgi:hypothetical protein
MIDSEEDLEKLESKYGSLKVWQKIIIASLILIGALWEVDINV